MKSRLLLSLALLLPAQITPAQQAGPEYTIRLARPLHAGDSFEVEAKGLIREERNVTLDGAAAKSEKAEIFLDFKGRETFRQVDARGLKPQALEVKVERLIYRLNGAKPAQLCKPGSVIRMISSEGENEFLIDGAQVNKPQRQILNHVLTLDFEDNPNDDEVFGVAKKVKPGEKWPINAAKLVSTNKLPFKPEEICGDVTLVAVESQDGEPCLKVKREYAIGSLQGIAPKGFTAYDSKARVETTTLTPLRSEAWEKASQIKRSLEGRFVGKRSAEGATEVISYTSLNELESRFTPLGKQ